MYNSIESNANYVPDFLLSSLTKVYAFEASNFCPFPYIISYT